jgi:hypothetical protein
MDLHHRLFGNFCPRLPPRDFSFIIEATMSLKKFSKNPVTYIRPPQTARPRRARGSRGARNLEDTQSYCRFFYTGFRFSDRRQCSGSLL